MMPWWWVWVDGLSPEEIQANRAWIEYCNTEIRRFVRIISNAQLLGVR